MDPADMMVAVLTVGIVALLVWFEINSRRNQARTKRELDRSRQSAQDREPVADAGTDERKAA